MVNLVVLLSITIVDLNAFLGTFGRAILTLPLGYAVTSFVLIAGVDVPTLAAPALRLVMRRF